MIEQYNYKGQQHKHPMSWFA